MSELEEAARRRVRELESQMSELGKENGKHKRLLEAAAAETTQLLESLAVAEAGMAEVGPGGFYTIQGRGWITPSTSSEVC